MAIGYHTKCGVSAAGLVALLFACLPASAQVGETSRDDNNIVEIGVSPMTMRGYRVYANYKLRMGIGTTLANGVYYRFGNSVRKIRISAYYNHLVQTDERTPVGSSFGFFGVSRMMTMFERTEAQLACSYQRILPFANKRGGFFVSPTLYYALGRQVMNGSQEFSPTQGVTVAYGFHTIGAIGTIGWDFGLGENCHLSFESGISIDQYFGTFSYFDYTKKIAVGANGLHAAMRYLQLCLGVKL